MNDAQWASIAAMVEKVVQRVAGSKGDFFTTGRVVKVDEINKCIYLAEFGDQAIPIVGFDYDVTYYDENATTTNKKTTVAKVKMPKVGETVFVAREMGTRRLPRCLGVIQGKKWFDAEEEE